MRTDAGSRLVSVVAVVTVLVVVIGVIAVRIRLRWAGWPDEPLMAWNPRALWLREHGWLLVFAPALWAVATTVRPSRPLLIAGFFLPLAIAAVFGEALGWPGVRHFPAF